MKRGLIVTSVLVGVAFGIVGAGWSQAPPVAANCTATLVSPAPAVSMFILPDGTGNPLISSFQFGGILVPAMIQVTLRGAAMMPSPAVPQTAIRLEHISPGVAWCPYWMYPPPPHGPNGADAPSNAAGNTQFTLAYHGGGWINTGTFVWVNQGPAGWAPIPMPLNLHINSADINGTGVVNLADVGIFAGDFFGPYAYRSDFNWDGIINLVDLAMMAPALGKICP